MHTEPFLYFQLLSLLLAIYFYKGLSRFSLLAFIPLLAILISLETWGVSFGKGNHFVYNLVILLTTPLYLFLYASMLRLRNNERVVFWAIAALALVFIYYNYFFWQGSAVFNNYSLIIVQILHVVFSVLVLFRLYSFDAYNGALVKSPYFWLSAANMLMGIVLLVLLGLQDYILKHNISVGEFSLYRYILPTANIIMYSLYSYAFILCRKQVTR